MWIIVQVPDLNLVSARLRINCLKQWSNDRGGFLAYALPIKCSEDVYRYTIGAYSKFSFSLKSIIFERSGLPYQKPALNGRTVTDIRLLALEGKEVVRNYIEEELHCIMDPDQEVLGIPSAESFMDVMEG